MTVFDNLTCLVHRILAWTKRHPVVVMLVGVIGMMIVDPLTHLKIFALLSCCWGLWYAFLSDDLDENEWQNWKK